MRAFVFPGQGAQFTGMGKDLYENFPLAKVMFEKANEILGFRITDIMFSGSSEQLKETKVTQPAIFLHSVILSKCIDNFNPHMAAGHSLGEFSALVAMGAITFEDGIRLVSKRANTSHHHHNNNMHSTTSTSYYATFEVESGDRMEFHISGKEYGMLAEGDLGKLMFQGTRYHSFTRSNNEE